MHHTRTRTRTHSATTTCVDLKCVLCTSEQTNKNIRIAQRERIFKYNLWQSAFCVATTTATATRKMYYIYSRAHLSAVVCAVCICARMASYCTDFVSCPAHSPHPCTRRIQNEETHAHIHTYTHTFGVEPRFRAFNRRAKWLAHSGSRRCCRRRCRLCDTPPDRIMHARTPAHTQNLIFW